MKKVLIKRHLTITEERGRQILPKLNRDSQEIDGKLTDINDRLCVLLIHIADIEITHKLI